MVTTIGQELAEAKLRRFKETAEKLALEVLKYNSPNSTIGKKALEQLKELRFN